MSTENDFKFLVGKTLEQAKQEIPQRYHIFVSQHNDKSFYRSMEFDPYRINVTVKNGNIYKIDGIN